MWAAGGLSAVALLWIPAFFEGVHSDAFTGAVILEVFTLIPLGLVVNRVRRLSRHLRHVRLVGIAEQEVDASELRRVDEALLRVARLTAQLPGGVPATRGLESFRALEEASHVWRRHVIRRQQIDRLLMATKGRSARAELEASLAQAREDAKRFESQVEDLAAALVALCERADDDSHDRHIARLGDATDQMRFLTAALDEVNAIAPATRS